MKMRVMIDGKEYRVQNDVRILYEGMDLVAEYAEPEGTDLHVILTPQGLMLDLVGPGETERPVVGSALRTLDDLIELTTGEVD